VIPTYNHAQYVRRAVESVLREGFDLVVVDDASEDDVASALAGLDVIVVRHDKNRGLSAARNTGIHLLSNRFVLPLDADDELFEGSVKKLLEHENDADVLYGNLYFRHDASVLRPNPDIHDYDFLSGNQLPGCSLYRRRLWEHVGGYLEERREYYEDWTFFGRIAKAGAKFKYVDVNVYNYLGPADGMCGRLAKNHEENKKYVIDTIKAYDGKVCPPPPGISRGTHYNASDPPVAPLR